MHPSALHRRRYVATDAKFYVTRFTRIPHDNYPPNFYFIGYASANVVARSNSIETNERNKRLRNATRDTQPQPGNVGERDSKRRILSRSRPFLKFQRVRRRSGKRAEGFHTRGESSLTVEERQSHVRPLAGRSMRTTSFFHVPGYTRPGIYIHYFRQYFSKAHVEKAIWENNAFSPRVSLRTVLQFAQVRSSSTEKLPKLCGFIPTSWLLVRRFVTRSIYARVIFLSRALR